MFSCFLPPPASGTSDVPPAADEIAHPRFHYQLGPSIPPALLRRVDFRDRFLPECPIAWVEQPAGALWPLWIPRPLARAVARLRPGEPPPPDLDPALAASLRGAGILVGAAALARADAAQLAQLAAAREVFATRAYVNTGSLLPPLLLVAVRDYYRELFASSAYSIGDPQCERRYGVHDEPLARYVHHQLAAVVGQIVGEPIIASYVYVASYRPGAVLHRHTDREQCEFSVTLLVDFEPDPEGPSPWPLHLEPPGGTVAVHQRVGDGLLYRGREQPHWRAALGDSCASTSLLLHYVRRDFTGSLR